MSEQPIIYLNPSTETILEKCEKCRFWVPTEADQYFGHCHRYPNTTDGGKPYTRDDDWCGEFSLDKSVPPAASAYEAVLAKVEREDGSTWFEVIYYDKEVGNWQSFDGSNTFSRNEKVIAFSSCSRLRNLLFPVEAYGDLREFFNEPDD